MDFPWFSEGVSDESLVVLLMDKFLCDLSRKVQYRSLSELPILFHRAADENCTIIQSKTLPYLVEQKELMTYSLLRVLQGTGLATEVDGFSCELQGP